MPVAPIRKMLVSTGILPCLAPSRPQTMQFRISFRSRSDLVLDADSALSNWEKKTLLLEEKKTLLLENTYLSVTFAINQVQILGAWRALPSLRGPAAILCISRDTYL